MRLNRN